MAAITAATAASSRPGKDSEMERTDMAVASAATLLAAQYLEAPEREHLASIVSSAVNVRSVGDIMTLIAASAIVLRGDATLKARVLKDVWNIADVLPMVKSMISGGGGSCSSASSGSYIGKLVLKENFLGICSRELLARGNELLK